MSLCKGSVQVYDNVPKGSLFVLYFPVERLEHIVSQPAVMPEGEQMRNRDEEASFGEEEYARQGNETLILLVDDNDDFRHFMRDTLKDNFSLIDASNGKEAWEKILAFSPDIIISDVMMPEMDGYELCAKVKNDLRTSHIPLILLTAHTAKEQEPRFGTGAMIFSQRVIDILLL